MRRARIAIITHLWPTAGAPHAGKPIYETALRLQEFAGVEVLCPAPGYPAARWLRPSNYVYHPADPSFSPPGLKTTYLEYRTVAWLGRAFNGLRTQACLQPALDACAPDLILAYWLYPTAWAAVQCARRMKVPVVVGARGSDLHRIPDLVARRCTATALRSADAVVTVTEELRRRAIALGAAPARVHAIANGCDTSIYHPEPRAAARAALGLPDSARLLLQVGHLLQSKGVLDLWEAFARLAPQNPELRLALVGEGPAEAELRARAATAHLTGRLILPGARPAPEIVQWMNAADLVCLASHGEGCPNVVVEALACGRPVMGTTVGGMPELVPPHCGLLVPARDDAALADAIAAALGRTWDSAAVAAFSQRSWEQVARETYSVCAEALAAPARRR
jgi:glycosyltransferase involved in cell wall biosynthesis